MAKKKQSRLTAQARVPSSLSKSKLLAFRQCERRLWLEVHWPQLREDSAGVQARMQAGHSVGEVARRLYDPAGKGRLLDVNTLGYTQALKQSQELLAARQPVFEAGFSAGGALAFADVLLPAGGPNGQAWRMVEVKSSTSVKDYHRDDAAAQAYAARSAGLDLAGISVAHIDSGFTYGGGGNYQGLLVEEDLTQEAFERHDEMQEWVRSAREVIDQAQEPMLPTGDHCSSPFECGFSAHCQAGEPQAEYPVQWLPRVQSKALKAHLAQPDVFDMRDVPDDLLNAKQQRVKEHTLSNEPWFDAKGAARALKACQSPLHFLDFETIQFAVPQWAGTRPYQQIPFQYSLHTVQTDGGVQHREFLDLSGNDPSEDFAKALVRDCAGTGSVLVYNAAFEKTRMKELAQRFPRLRQGLLGIVERVVDLLPVVEAHYYHPAQQGSWSIKKVLPAMVPDLSYQALDGVQDGGGAMEAYLEAIHPQTQPARRNDLQKQLLAYCGLDTWAMVRIWQELAAGGPGSLQVQVQ